MLTIPQVLCCGLPASGKTTYLGALWHTVTEREIRTALGFHSLGVGDNSYINEVATRWRNAQPQIRTEVGAEHLVGMNLQDSTGKLVQLSFPDLSGETFKGMWAERDCDPSIAKIINARSAILLLIHSDRIVVPRWIVDEVADGHALGVQDDAQAQQEVPWQPDMTPTQVMLVDLLQMLACPPLGEGPQHVAVILSAWDKVEIERRSPAEFLAERLPLLHQYLTSTWQPHTWKVYGVSAQGGDFSSESKRILSEDIPSKRIKLVGTSGFEHDLTEPIRWLMN